MEGYAEYQNLLSDNLSTAEAQFQNAKEKFESGLARAGELKGVIDRTTEFIGAPFLIDPLKKGLTGAFKKGVEKLTGKKFKQDQPQDKPQEKVETKTDTPNENPEPNEAPEGETQVERQFQPYGDEPAPPPRNAQPSQVESGEGEEPYRLPGDNRPPESTTRGAESFQEGASAEPGEAGAGAEQETSFGGEGALTQDVAPAVAENVGENIGENVGIDLTEGLLDADPFTAIFGLIFGALTIGGGIAGAEDVKTPSAPQFKMPQASTQFGF